MTSRERIASLDILRGFAVMAIFIVNIKAMLAPFGFYMNPSLWATDFDQHIAILHRFLVEDKWRSIFTALYGAGMLMISDRLVARCETRPILLRRNLWLLLFGLIHMVGMWVGDILFNYALVGLIAMLFVRMETPRLWFFGLIILSVGVLWAWLSMVMLTADEAAAAELAAAMWQPSGEALKAEIAGILGSILEQVMSRAFVFATFMVPAILFAGLGAVSLGLMVLGMALYRTGLLRGTWPLRWTLPLAGAALTLAWALDGVQLAALTASGYDFSVFIKNSWMASLDAVFGALGYVCLVSALVSMGMTFRSVAAVGRMAFTNYILCTIIGTSLAGGHAFGLFNQMHLVEMMVIVLVTFIGMLIWSTLWLKTFRFGPLEWLWRSLVYGMRQPLRDQRPNPAGTG